MKHYSPNHPSMRDQQPSVAQRREAVRQRVGSRSNPTALKTTIIMTTLVCVGALATADKYPLTSLAVSFTSCAICIKAMNDYAKGRGW